MGCAAAECSRMLQDPAVQTAECAIILWKLDVQLGTNYKVDISQIKYCKVMSESKICEVIWS